MLTMRVQDDKQTNVGGPSLGQHRKADKWFRNGCRVRDEKLRQLVLSMHHSGGTGAAKRCRSRTKGFVRVQRASSSPVDFFLTVLQPVKREAVKVLLESGALLARSCRLKTISNESRQELPRFGTACGLVFVRRQAMELQTANVRRFMETTLQEQAGN